MCESRKLFLNRFETFERSVRDIAEQVENNSRIETATWNQTLQRLEQLQKQLQTMQPLVSTIGEELTELEHSGLSKIDLQTIRNTFDTYRKRIQT